MAMLHLKVLYRSCTLLLHFVVGRHFAISPTTEAVILFRLSVIHWSLSDWSIVCLSIALASSGVTTTFVV